jgi:hypothetical protein
LCRLYFCTFYAIVYHIECASTYYTKKKSGFKESRNRDIKVSLLGQAVLVGLILSGYLLILDRKRNDIEYIPITTPTAKK